MASGVSLSFGATQALRGIDLSVLPGERLAVFGPNGAGKTTLLRVLAMLARPSSGSLIIAGRDPAREGRQVRGLIGYAGHQTLLYPELTAAENLRYYGRLYRVSDLAARVETVLEQVGLFQRRDEQVTRLSRGMQQRLSIARAILHDPPILLLDEPETGLDVQALQVLESAIVGNGHRSRTVVLTTHNLQQGVRLAGRLAILIGGRLVHEQPSAGLDGADVESLYRRLLSAAA